MTGLVFILSAPAGTGKTTLVRKLSEEFSNIYQSISCTTRPPRPGEVEGKDYHFLSAQEFEKKQRAGDFLESANVFGYDYGTSKSLVHAQQEKGMHVFLVIDTQGALILKQAGLKAVFIFISPPSLEELHKRLVDRQTDSPEVIEKRLSWAKREMARVKEYDYHIVNDQLEQAYSVLRSIVIAEEHRVR
jgi:guanylate kinase